MKNEKGRVYYSDIVRVFFLFKPGIEEHGDYQTFRYIKVSPADFEIGDQDFPRRKTLTEDGKRHFKRLGYKSGNMGWEFSSKEEMSLEFDHHLKMLKRLKNIRR